MADISISLTLDDSQFQTILKKVDTNTTAFGANLKKTMAESTAAVDSLTKIIGALSGKIGELTAQISNNNQALSGQVEKLDQATTKALSMSGGVDKLVGSFDKLATALVGASLGSFILNAVHAASDTARMAEAVGVSTTKFLELSAGAQAAGKDQDSMARAMLRMEATAQQANDGSARLKNAYHQLGITMDDLHKLSPDEAFLKVAKALAAMEDPGKKAELTMMLLGRDAKTVDWPSFVAGAERAAGSMYVHAASIENASRAYREVQAGLTELKRNILDILDPLLRLIGDNAHGFLGATATAKAFIAILGATAISTAVGTFNMLVRAVAGLATTFGVGAGSNAAFEKTMRAASAAAAEAAVINQRLTVAMAELTASEGAYLGAVNAVNRAEMTMTMTRTEFTAITNAATAAQERFVAAQASVAAITAGTTAATAAAGTTAVATTGAFAGLRAVLASLLAPVAAVVGFFTAPAWATIAAVVAALAVAVTGLTVVWKAFGGVITDYVGGALSWVMNKLKEVGTAFNDWTTSIANGWRHAWGMMSIEAEEKLEAINKRLKNLPSTGAGGGRGGGASFAPLLTNAGYDPEIAKQIALQNRFELMQKEHALAVDRINKERDLVNASEEVRKTEMARFEAASKATLDRMRLTGQLKVLEAENKDPNMDKTLEIAELKKELGAITSNANAMAQATKELVNQQNTRALLLHGTEEYNKIMGKTRAIEEEAASAAASNVDKAVAGLRKEEEAALDVAKRKALALGITESDRRLVEELELIRQGFDQVREATIKFTQAKLEVSQKKIFDAEDLKVGKQIADIKVQITELTMSAYEKQLAAIDKLKNADIERMILELKNANNGIISKEQEKAVIDKVNEAYREQTKVTKDLQTAANSFDTGFTQAWHSFADKAGTAADAGKAAFDGFANAVNSSIDALTSHSKMSFKGMVDSFIMSLLNSQLKSSFGQMMGAMGISQGFSLGGFSAALFGGGAGAGGTTDEYGPSGGSGILSGVGSFFSSLFHANGGSIPAGGFGIVGEAGPEIVNGPASITSAKDTASMMGGDTHYHNYNINAVDAKSVAQLFYENRMTMFGMTEQARREIPLRTR